MSIEKNSIICDKDLASFCENKLESYIVSIKSCIQDENFLQLHCILMELSHESQGLGAFHISCLSKNFAKQIKDTKLPISESDSLARILRILENLSKESRDYTFVEWHKKKIDLLDSFRSTRITETIEKYDEDYDIEKEFREQWKCCMF